MGKTLTLVDESAKPGGERMPSILQLVTFKLDNEEYAIDVQRSVSGSAI
ncbi:MAG: hypothetical protein HQL08_01700 [Nitrospirae bacterium]|nr:hypothetical protein [Nitrospirota bacterium]